MDQSEKVGIVIRLVATFSTNPTPLSTLYLIPHITGSGIKRLSQDVPGIEIPPSQKHLLGTILIIIPDIYLPVTFSKWGDCHSWHSSLFILFLHHAEALMENGPLLVSVQAAYDVLLIRIV